MKRGRERGREGRHDATVRGRREGGRERRDGEGGRGLESKPDAQNGSRQKMRLVSCG